MAFRRAAAASAVCAALVAVVLWIIPSGAAGAQTTTTTPSTSSTTAPPTTAPPTTTPAQRFVPGLSPDVTLDQLFAFFRAVAAPRAPLGSGVGRRIVYSHRAQRVWLDENDESVVRTYLVSGRVGLPRIGTYRIYSTSRFASSGAVRMQYMMRFAKGRSMAIGFHTIPVRRNGSPIQTLGELGTHRSHGCVRQNPVDAAFLWGWAGVGTTVIALP